jgi:hypothetical protein
MSEEIIDWVPLIGSTELKVISEYFLATADENENCLFV